MKKENRWRIYNRRSLVDPFQLRIVGVAVCHFMLVILIFVSALFLPIIIELQSGDISSPHVQAAARGFLFLHNRLWAPLLGALVLLVLHNIIVTHRIAGPLYRFRRYLKSVGDGDLSSPIKFRKKDYLKKEAQVASCMVESLRDKVASVERQLEQVSWAWTEMRSALADETGHDLQLKIDAMDDHIEECRAGLEVFKTTEWQAPTAAWDQHAPSARSAAITSDSEELVEIEV
ncbi:MAG TPA: hypothetical protein VMX58_03690 [Patescibacteria group bacterium]|nr:hypothetical protein [Patescibacteria group bacterium]